MAEISLTNTINVSLSATPSGLSEFVIANTGLFSTDTPSFADEYRVYTSPRDVATDFGSSSLTYKMANALFAQSPNIRTGRGSLYVIPYVATSGTQGTAETPNLIGNIDNFKLITDGALKLTIDGVAVQLSNLNFSGITTIADVVNVILSKTPDCFVEAVTGTSTASVKFTSKLIGTTSTIAFATSATGTDITGANYLNTSAVTPVAGTNAVNTESLTDAVNRISDKIFIGGVLDTCYRDNASILANATSIQAMDKIYFEGTASLINIDELGADIKAAGNTKTRLLAYSVSLEGSKTAIAAYASKAVSPNFNASQTANTMNLKELATVLPDTNLSQTIFVKAQTAGVDIYASTGGLSVCYSNSNGAYTDDVVNQLWLKKAFEVAGFNNLKQTNTKIPQTEAGMTGLKNAYSTVCERAVRSGILGTGLIWNSAERFGDPEDFDRNIDELGYYIYSLPIAQQSQADREGRIAPVCQLAMKFAGSIHSSDLLGIIER
jgi:hypothetical protein